VYVVKRSDVEDGVGNGTRARNKVAARGEDSTESKMSKKTSENLKRRFISHIADWMPQTDGGQRSRRRGSVRRMPQHGKGSSVVLVRVRRHGWLHSPSIPATHSCGLSKGCLVYVRYAQGTLVRFETIEKVILRPRFIGDVVECP